MITQTFFDSVIEAVRHTGLAVSRPDATPTTTLDDDRCTDCELAINVAETRSHDALADAIAETANDMQAVSIKLDLVVRETRSGRLTVGFRHIERPGAFVAYKSNQDPGKLKSMVPWLAGQVGV